ncbi:MAG: sterol carrier protein domain-containing protein, partial [Lachnospiraceae bacterium]|nr:sterol carrier protein domain-containing protein [Lachnospiraceae bacterium]
GVSAWGAEDERMLIRERVADPAWEQGEKRNQLLGALQRRFAGQKVTAVTDGFLGQKKSAIMGRIVCLEAFLTAFSVEEETELLLQVRDPLLPENDGLFLWTVGPEGAKLARAEDQRTPDMAKAAGIRTLSRTWFNEEV